MGAVANRAGELFAGIVAEVPFVDVLNTMLDDTLPLTPPEWPEWGNPIESEKDFRTILSYSPYDNVAAKDYPAILAMGGLTDPRVTYWEPAKWIARLRATMTGGGPVLLRTNMGAGHGGASGRFDRLDEVAIAYAFALWAVGMAEGEVSARSASSRRTRDPRVIYRFATSTVEPRCNFAKLSGLWSASHGTTIEVSGVPTARSSSATRQNRSASVVGRRIEPEDAAALADFLGDEILERGHLEGLVGDLVGEMRGDHDHAVAVAEDDVAGKHRRVAAADRHVDLDRLMQRQIGRRARPVVIGGKAELGDLGGIAKAAIGDDAGDSRASSAASPGWRRRTPRAHPCGCP